MSEWSSVYGKIFTVMGGLSILGSTILIALYFWKRELRSGSFKRVFWMSVCDLFLSLKFWLMMVTRTPVSMDRDRPMCYLSAIAGNFFTTATISWYFIIAVCVFSVFQPERSKWRYVMSNELIQHAYVWTLSALCAFLPLATDSYGGTDDGTQCWIPDSRDPMKLTLVLPLYSYLVFAFYLLFYVFFKSSTRSVLDERLKERMLLFVGIFAFAWFWPGFATAWDFISPDTQPIYIHYMDVGAICGSGLCNFIVWITHPAYRGSLMQCCLGIDEASYTQGMTTDPHDVSMHDVTTTSESNAHKFKETLIQTTNSTRGASPKPPGSKFDDDARSTARNRIDYESVYRPPTINEVARDPSRREITQINPLRN